MTKQLLIIIGILILLNSCKQTESKITKESDVKEIVEAEKETTELASVADSYIENDSLTALLISELEKITSNPKFTIEKEPTKNRHVDSLMDTIITRTFDKTKLESYKAASEEWVYNAKIENTDFELVDYIKVGIKKYVVEKSLTIGIPNDILIIGNLELTSQFILKFESGNLKTIEFEGYMD